MNQLLSGRSWRRSRPSRRSRRRRPGSPTSGRNAGGRRAAVAGRTPLCQASAAFTRAGVIGICRTRAPVASKIALAIAAPIVMIAGSPPPCAGRSGESRITRLDLRQPREARQLVGVEVPVEHLAVLEPHLLGRARSRGPCVMQPSICCCAPSGFTTHAHVLRAHDAHDLDRAGRSCPPSPRRCSRRRCRRRCRSATPKPAPARRRPSASSRTASPRPASTRIMRASREVRAAGTPPGPRRPSPPA